MTRHQVLCAGIVAFGLTCPAEARDGDKLFAHFMDEGYEEDEIDAALDDLLEQGIIHAAGAVH